MKRVVPIVLLVYALLFLGFICFSWTARADTQAVCTPIPPATAVLVNESACTVVGGNPQMSVTVHVLVTVAKKTGDTTALIYGISSSRDFTILSPVGSIGLGVTCDGSQMLTVSGSKYYVVPSLDKSIIWSGTPRIRVYSQCI